MTEEERTEQARLNKILEKVRKLVAMANADIAPGATPEEREATEQEQERARTQADVLMLKYAIDAALVADAQPAGFRAKPVFIEVLVGGGALYGYTSWLAQRVAEHTRCKIRTGIRYDRDVRGYVAKVYGFEGDVRFFEMLFTSLQLHMLGALRPKVQDDLTVEENAYRLHNAGYNWYEIAKLQGWREVTRYPGEPKFMYENKATGERAGYAQVVGVWKNAYLRACKAKGERPVKVPANGSETFRHSAVEGYTDRISQRFREQKQAMDREAGERGTVVLKSRMETLEDFWREDNPDMFTKCPRCGKMSSNPYECSYCGQFIKDRPELGECKKCKAAKSGYCRDHALRAYRPTPHNAAGYRAGTSHANSADLMAGGRVGGDSRKHLG